MLGHQKHKLIAARLGEAWNHSPFSMNEITKKKTNKKKLKENIRQTNEEVF